MEASENSLSAAEVAIYTEVVAALGATAGILTSWIGWRLHDSQVPAELAVPDRGEKLPPQLRRPPPDRRVSTCFRPSVQHIVSRIRTGASSSSAGPSAPSSTAPVPTNQQPSAGAASSSAAAPTQQSEATAS